MGICGGGKRASGGGGGSLRVNLFVGVRNVGVVNKWVGVTVDRWTVGDNDDGFEVEWVKLECADR